MNVWNRQFAPSWFRSRGGRRYGLELALVVAAKLIALAILYFAFIAPQPRTDVSAGAVQRHMLGTASPNQPVAP